MNQESLSFGYCTNVHAGSTLEAAKLNLATHATLVREQVCPTGKLPIGLWLADLAVESLIESGEVRQFGDWLQAHNLVPYTFNGFPQGDFHQPVVKYAVYEPTWCCDSRPRYTMELAEVLEAILPTGNRGSISTLPLGWPHAPWHSENFKLAADNLLHVAKFLRRLSESKGSEIVLAIEPEPGCVLNTASEVVEFFDRFLFSGPDAEVARRYLTVCHDICHSGVMFEPQAEALQMYLDHGIRIGKVQVSSAVHVPWDQCCDKPEDQAAMLNQLRGFDEPKYLHQTSMADAHGRLKSLATDLPEVLARWPQQNAGGPEVYPSDPWRVHFHVPIYVDKFGHLATTQGDIARALGFLESHASHSVAGTDWFTGHYEVETYAWPVLPPSLAVDCLATGIARELKYFAQVLEDHRPKG